MPGFVRISTAPKFKDSFAPRKKSKWLGGLLITYIVHLSLASIYSSVIWAHSSSSDFRCSHLPPLPEQISHVWLDDANFSASIEETKSSSSPTISENLELESQTRGGKARRHIDDRKDYINSELTSTRYDNSDRSSILERSESSDLFDKDDLVPIKIEVYYDDSVFLLEKQKFKLITKTVIPSVVKFFESVLSIKREYTISRFRISRRCPNNTIYYAKDVVGLSRPYCMDRCERYAICGEMIVPRAHLAACSYCNSTSKRCTTDYSNEGRGVANAQLLLYVSAQQTSRCKKDQTIAYAAHCAQDAKTDRPVAGHANLCPMSISTDPKDLRALIATVKHELTHVLGFSVSLFAYYRDETGQPLTERNSSPGPIEVDPKTGYAKWGEKIIKTFTRPNWVTGEGVYDREVHLMVTPTVVREVRSHFNCSTLEGAELEDQGSDGTSMTHWEKRLFENEAMTGTHTQNSVYSRLTLAVLQDTGWYVSNFTKAEKLDWGKDLGCDFALKSCRSWIEERRATGRSIRPFCDRVKGDLLHIACTEDRTSKAVCNMKQYKDPLPLAYQNFANLEGISNGSLEYYGGSVDLADYCPFIQEFTWQAQNVTVRGSRCDISGNNLELERNAALEFYGPQTKCFEHGRRWEQRSCVYKRHWHHYGAGCYKYSCSNGLHIMVGNHTYPCYYPDQLVHIEQVADQWLYNGTIICPACEKVCPPQECKSYDKSIIDKILKLNYELKRFAAAKLIEPVGNIVDETKNDISTRKEEDAAVTKALMTRKRLLELEFNNSSATEDLVIYEEKFLQIIRDHIKRPRHELVCSDARTIYTHHHILVLLTFAISIFHARLLAAPIFTTN